METRISLETGHVYDDVENINNIIQEAEDYLVGGPIYQYSVPDRHGSPVSMREYRGKVLLIVNTATGYFFSPVCQDRCERRRCA